jgi:hypothetical protein
LGSTRGATAAAVIALVLLLAAPARADVRFGPAPPEIKTVYGYFFGAVGVRHSFGAPGTGAHLGGGGGVMLGPFGLELEGSWTADGASADDRVAVRSASFLNLRLAVPLGRIALLSVFGGPGLGWVKPPGLAQDVGGRRPSGGLHEGLRVEFILRRAETIIGIGMRAQVSHLWQQDVVTSPDHAFSVQALVSVGGLAPLGKSALVPRAPDSRPVDDESP